MQAIGLSSPLSDACAVVGALILFGAALLETPLQADPATTAAQRAAVDVAARTGTSAHGAPGRAAR